MLLHAWGIIWIADSCTALQVQLHRTSPAPRAIHVTTGTLAFAFARAYSSGIATVIVPELMRPAMISLLMLLRAWGIIRIVQSAQLSRVIIIVFYVDYRTILACGMALWNACMTIHVGITGLHIYILFSRISGS
eukprot:COSAG01_NODE_16479_length_1233_cov_1.583774_1_plen_134_part_00